MKKLVFLLAAVLFSSLIMRSQNVLDTIFDKYFLPDFIDVELCGSLLFYDQTGDNINTHMARNHYAFDVTGRTYDSIDGGWGRNSGVLDRAQPCYTDTLLTVKGIAVGVNYHTLFKWVQDSTGWWCKHADGSYTKSDWEKIDGEWYYFDERGYAYQNRWLKDNGKWYYFKDNCKMAHSETLSYSFRENGEYIE